MEKDRQCPYCNKTFFSIEGRTFSNHVKWCESNPNTPKSVKCEKCGKVISSNGISLHNCEEKKTKCIECGKSFYKKQEEKFCSQTCAAVHNNYQRKTQGYISPLKGVKYEIVDKVCKSCGSIFQLAKNQHQITECDTCRDVKVFGNRKYKVIHSKCVICGNETSYKTGHKVKQTCSKKCYHSLLSINSKNNPKCGGETNYKKFVYKDISMDSSWEVRIATLMDSLNIKWERSKKLLLWWYDENNKKRRYHPDFYLPEFDLYLDTKNKYLIEQDSYKIKKVIENNKVKLYVGDIDDVEKYVKSLSTGL